MLENPHATVTGEMVVSHGFMISCDGPALTLKVKIPQVLAAFEE